MDAMKGKKGIPGAKASESAQAEGLRDKQNAPVKDLYKPHDNSNQRMPKGSDRA